MPLFGFIFKFSHLEKREGKCCNIRAFHSLKNVKNVKNVNFFLRSQGTFCSLFLSVFQTFNEIVLAFLPVESKTNIL